LPSIISARGFFKRRQTDFARTSVQNVLTSTGLLIRRNKKAKKITIKRKNSMKGGPVPYGHATLRGCSYLIPKNLKLSLTFIDIRKKEIAIGELQASSTTRIFPLELVKNGPMKL
jgi:hypothetical protein